jgi:hypothetical protein
MKKNVPYTYLIGWSKHNVWYYGVRYSKKCHPSDLWVTYYTSSKYVREYRLVHGEPDVVGVRKTFANRERAVLWEERVIRRMKMLSDERWLNRSNAGRSFVVPKKLPDEWKNKIRMNRSVLTGNKNPMYGKTGTMNPNYDNKWSDDKKRSLSETRIGENNPNYGKKWDKDKRKEASKKITGDKNPMFGKTGSLNPNYGNKTKWSCPVCKKVGGISAMRGHHGMFGEKCIQKLENQNEK